MSRVLLPVSNSLHVFRHSIPLFCLSVLTQWILSWVIQTTLASYLSKQTQRVRVVFLWIVPILHFKCIWNHYLDFYCGSLRNILPSLNVWEVFFFSFFAFQTVLLLMDPISVTYARYIFISNFDYVGYVFSPPFLGMYPYLL